MKRSQRSGAEATILVLAFEPFGGRNVNRSQLVLEHIARAASSPRGIRQGVRVITRTLPVAFSKLGRAVDRALAHRPDIVLLLGESGRADELHLERVAVNRIEARLPDNEGSQPRAARVVESGPAAYFTSLPLEPALAAVRRAGVSASISTDCGLFACNATYYLALHKLRAQRAPIPVVFVHVPVKSRAMALRTATRGVLALLRHLLDRQAPRGTGSPTRTPQRKLPATSADSRKA